MLAPLTDMMSHGYNNMRLSGDDSTYYGSHYETTGFAAFAEHFGLARADSMDIVNDPRFFTDNVLNYRLSAFAGLAVISGFLLQNAMDQLFGMSKNMPIFNSAKEAFSVHGILTLISFCLLIAILMANLLATYIGVAQPYHTMRLMTAGPTGFDAAASYYLNPNIVSYRHYAIKAMLACLPLYLFQMGLRLVVRFERDTEDTGVSPPETTPWESQIQGITFCVIFQILALMLLVVHGKHFSIFRERYEIMAEVTKPVQAFAASEMMPSSFARATGTYSQTMRSHLDV